MTVRQSARLRTAGVAVLGKEFETAQRQRTLDYTMYGKP
jgi:hypothetical protein